MTGSLVRISFSILMLFSLLGCDQTSEQQNMVEDYVWRLSNVLDQPFELDSVEVISYPDKRFLTLEFTNHSVDLLDFLAMTGCRLQITAAERNSVLGRVMPYSQAFLYHWQFIEDSDECLDHLQNTDPELHQLLLNAARAKREELSRHYWLSVWVGPEMRSYFGATQQWLSLQQQVLLAPEVFQTFSTLAMFSRDISSRDISESIQHEQGKLDQSLRVANFREPLETSFGWLSRQSTGGQVLATLAGMTRLLNQGTNMLESDAAARICPMGQVTPDARILHTVFTKFYIGRVQPYMSFLHQEVGLWYEQQQILLETVSFDMPQAFEQFVMMNLDSNYQQGLWQSYQTAVRKHTIAWQSILKECGLMPGSN